MQSDCPSVSSAEAYAAPAPLPPRWKKPSSGPLSRMRDGNQGPCGRAFSRSELKRGLRAAAKAAGLTLTVGEARRGSHASVRVDGGLDDVGRLGPADVRVDVGHGTVQRLWSDADEVTLLAAAGAFRESTGRVPGRPDAGALYGSIKGSISPNIEVGMAIDRLNGLENEFLQGRLGASDDPHGGRMRDLCAALWGATDVVPRPLPDDGSDGEEEGEEDVAEERHVADDDATDSGERCLATETESTSEPAPLPGLDAQVPNAGLSASTTDAEVVPTLPSPSRSVKCSCSDHRQPSVDEGCLGRIPSPRRLGTPASADISAFARAAAAAARGCEDITVRVDGDVGEYDDVQSHGTAAGISANVGDGTAQMLEPTDHGAPRHSHKAWSDADEVTLLNGAVACRERTGRVPGDADARVLLRSVRGSISPLIDEVNVSNILRRLKNMFRHGATGESATEHYHRVHDLSDEGAVMPVVTEMLSEFWKVNKRAMAGLPLEKGLSLLGKRKGRLIETKWRQQLDEELQTQMQRHALAKEVSGLLNDTIMDLDP